MTGRPLAAQRVARSGYASRLTVIMLGAIVFAALVAIGVPSRRADGADSSYGAAQQ